MKRLRRILSGVSPSLVLGVIIIAFLVLISAFPGTLTQSDPNQSSVFMLADPDGEHWFGTDALGRDIYARLLFGGRPALIVGIGAAVIAVLAGVPIGLAAGFLGGWIDVAASQLVNLFIALPGLILSMILTAMLGPTLLNLTLVLGFVGWPRVARLVRGQALALREMLFVEAARASGGGGGWIMRRHILPNTTRIIAAQFSLTVAYSIFTSASLSFLGIGVPPPTPDWGGMVRDGLDYLAINPTMSLAPAIAIGLLVLGFYFIGSSQK